MSFKDELKDLLNQVAYRGYVAGQGKDRGDAENLYIQSEIVVERATQAIINLIDKEIIGENNKVYRTDDVYRPDDLHKLSPVIQRAIKMTITADNILRQSQRAKLKENK